MQQRQINVNEIASPIQHNPFAIRARLILWLAVFSLCVLASFAVPAQDVVAHHNRYRGSTFIVQPGDGPKWFALQMENRLFDRQLFVPSDPSDHISNVVVAGLAETRPRIDSDELSWPDSEAAEAFRSKEHRLRVHSGWPLRCWWGEAVLVGDTVYPAATQIRLIRAHGCICRDSGSGGMPIVIPVLPRWPQFALNAVLCAALAWLLVTLGGLIMTWFGWGRSYGENACPACGYLLGAAKPAGCPECGWNRPSKEENRTGLIRGKPLG